MMPYRALAVVTWPRAAAGERIVAFARPGKPLGNPPLGTDWTRFRGGIAGENAAGFQRFLKPAGLK